MIWPNSCPSAVESKQIVRGRRGLESKEIVRGRRLFCLYMVFAYKQTGTEACIQRVSGCQIVTLFQSYRSIIDSLYIKIDATYSNASNIMSVDMHFVLQKAPIDTGMLLSVT